MPHFSLAMTGFPVRSFRKGFGLTGMPAQRKSHSEWARTSLRGGEDRMGARPGARGKTQARPPGALYDGLALPDMPSSATTAVLASPNLRCGLRWLLAFLVGLENSSSSNYYCCSLGRANSLNSLNSSRNR